MNEIDLTLALQLQAQFEEEARVYLLQEELERRKAEEISVIASWRGNQNSSSTSGNGSTSGRLRDVLKGQLEEPDQEKLSVSLVDPSWELIDPNPDIHSLFIAFNRQFFWGRLHGVEVKWSPRMTLCAGVCSYEGRGGLCSVRLSVPLLKLRPRKDLIETLLHEMIHAYLFVTANNRDRDGHGPEFHKHMYRINKVAGTNISVYHSFHDEVDVYRQHVWRCNGPCRTRRPYFGLVKRAMNRPPGPRDPWWQQHQNTCGGSYTKIQEPEEYGKKKKHGRGKVVKKDTGTYGDIRKFIEFKGKGNSLSGHSSGPVNGHSKENIPTFNNASWNGRRHDVIDPREDKTVITSKAKRKIESHEGIDFGACRSSDRNKLMDGSPRKDGTQSLFGSSTKTDNEKRDNIHGFSTSGTGMVKYIDVSNASKSNVHGFGGSRSPARKRSNRGSGMTRGVVGRGSGSGLSGSRKGSAANTSGGFIGGTSTAKQGRGGGGGSRKGSAANTSGGFIGGTSTAKQGRGGGGLAVRGRGGSTTVVVKGRGITKTEAKPDHESETKNDNAAVFQGSGFALGGSGTGVSRLLSLTTPAVPHSNRESSSLSPQIKVKNKANEDNHQHSLQVLQNSQSSQDLDDDHSSRCPLCDRDIPESELNQHLDDCMGMFEDSMDISERNEDELVASMDARMQDLRSSDECIVLNTSCEGSSQSASVENWMSGKGQDNNSMCDEDERDVYPCPVCGEKYSQSAMNPHLDSHF